MSMPDGQHWPIDALVAAYEGVLRAETRGALEYGGSQGFAGLREWLASDYSATESVPVTAQNIVLTSGGAGGLKDLCDAWIEPGDVILTEQPTFAGSLRTLFASGEVIGLTNVPNGLHPDALEDVVKEQKQRGKRVKLLHTVPNFNNPTAVLLSL